MAEMELASAADLHGVFLVVQLVRGEIAVIQFRVGRLLPPESVEFLVQRVDLLDSAMQSQAERLHRTFKALQEPDFHHTDEYPFTALLGEVVVYFGGVLRQGFVAEIVPQVAGGIVQRQRQSVDFVVHRLERQGLVFAVDGRMDRLRLGASRELAESAYLRAVAAQQLLAGAGDAQAVEKRDEIAAEFE